MKFANPHMHEGCRRTRYELTVHLAIECMDRKQRHGLKCAIAEAGGLKFSGQWARRRAVDAAQRLKGMLPSTISWVNVSRTTLQSIATVGKY